VAVDGAGNLYVADYLNHTIRQVTPVGTNWVVTTIAGVPGVSGLVDGPGTAAKFDYPLGVAVDTSNHVYVADGGNAAVRKMTLVGTTWQVTIVSQSFSRPTGVAVGPDGNLYVADSSPPGGGQNSSTSVFRPFFVALVYGIHIYFRP
jgi:sugar lactone lactonase YvrE